jgi:hypothetical protein
MAYVVGALAVLAIVALLVGALTGRVRMRSCCAVADPAKDLRMRDAYEPHQPTGRRAPALNVAVDTWGVSRVTSTVFADRLAR